MASRLPDEDELARVLAAAFATADRIQAARDRLRAVDPALVPLLRQIGAWPAEGC